MTRGLIDDERGSLLFDAAIAFVPVLLLFAALCQTCDLYAHKLIVQRAAAAAARAAVVILPDDGARYGDPSQRYLDMFAGGRRRAVEQAAFGLLRASGRIALSSARLELSGRFAPGGFATAQLSVDYTCMLKALPLLCGSDGKARLRASARLTYQGARYPYAKRSDT